MFVDLVEHIAIQSTAEFCTRRTWTPDEDDFLRANLRTLTRSEIGQALGRSADAVRIRQVRQQIPSPSRTPGYYTGQQAARILCVDVHNITELHKRGLIPTITLPGDRAILSISHNALYTWAVNPLHWIYFKPERVRDLHLRRLCELRAERWDDEWWTTGQIAEYYGLASSNSVTAAIYRGQLPAVRWYNWQVLRSAALAHPFYAGKGSSTGRSDWSDRSDAFLLRAKAEGKTYHEISRMMKWPETRVRYRADCLKRLRANVDIGANL